MAETTKNLPVSVTSKALREMEVGDKLTADVCRLGSVRSQCYMYGLQWNRKYTTVVDRANRTVTVTRMA